MPYRNAPMASNAHLPQQSMPKRAMRPSKSRDLSVYLAVILGYLMLLPPQLNMSILGSSIPPYRFFLIAAALYVLGGAMRGRLRFAWPDLAIIAAVAWICLAMSITSEWQEALTGSIAHITDIALAYLFARTAFRDLRDLRTFLILLLPGLLVTGVIMVLEAVTHTHIIQEAFSQLTGKPIVYGSTPRLGLMRAQGPFPHPILAGIFLSSFLSLYWLSGFKRWTRNLGAIAAICSIVTVSSATFLSLIAVIALLSYNWLSEKIANFTWSLFFVFFALFVFAAELGTKSGTFSLILRFASLNSMSGYFRILIWDYGTQNVAENPWFGIGYAEWTRPVWMSASIDNYWLLTAIRFGAPASILVGVATVATVVLIIRKSMSSQWLDQRLERGLAVAVTVFALGLMSVSIWLSAQVWFFVLLGLTVSLAQAGQTTIRQPYASGQRRFASSSREQSTITS